MRNTIGWLLLGTLVLSMCPTSLQAGESGEFPYELKLWREVGLMATAAGLYGLSEWADDPTSLSDEDRAHLSRSDVPSFDRGALDNFSTSADDRSDVVLGALAGSAALYALLLEPVQGNGDVSSCDKAYTLFWMGVETAAITYFMTDAVKNTVRRERPYAYGNEELDDELRDGAKVSFYSGHTSSAFAAATFMSTVFSHTHPDSKWTPCVWGASLAAASWVGYDRYEAGKHFPSDIVVGAVMGGLTGWLVPRVLEKDGDSLSLVPVVLHDAPGLALARTF